jgi:thiamine kinase-like enzyme
MVSDLIDDDSDVRVNRKNELVLTNKAGNAMVGISYLTGSDCEWVKERISSFCKDNRHDNDFWESTLYEKDRMIVTAKVVHASDVTEINTYEQLRDLDDQSNQLNSEAIHTIENVFAAKPADITDITILKKGMTNRSFLFCCKGEKYIMRIPGEGTDQLINRREEADVYRTIGGFHFCDDPVYINPENGYKITKFLNGVRECDPCNDDDLNRCMELLRRFHDEKLKVNHSFDLFEKMEFYESLWNGSGSMHQDYAATKRNVLKLRAYIDQHKGEYSLTHIDAVPDNFLFYKDASGAEQLQLTDWEYAGMQDPHVDIAMFCIYSLYDKKQVDHLIDLYFHENCSEEVRTKIYCYIATCGLLWSNWCEYKAHLGVEFGEYSLRQYRYAKDFYRYAVERM